MESTLEREDKRRNCKAEAACHKNRISDNEAIFRVGLFFAQKRIAPGLLERKMFTFCVAVAVALCRVASLVHQFRAKPRSNSRDETLGPRNGSPDFGFVSIVFFISKVTKLAGKRSKRSE